MRLHSINSSSLAGEEKIKPLSPLEEKLMGILKAGPQTRNQLVKKLATPRTTIYEGLKNLILRNEVKKCPVYVTERSRGRPQILFSILGDD